VPLKTASDSLPALNSMQEAFAREVAFGSPAGKAMITAGYKPEYAATHTDRLLKMPHVVARINELRQKLIDDRVVTARELYEQWSDMLRADISDIIEPETTEAVIIDGKQVRSARREGQYKPIKEWPKIWRQMLTGCDIKELFERSKDGGDKSWDQVGQVVKLRWLDILRVGELVGRLKPIDAFVKQQAPVTLELHIHAQVEERLTRAREIAAGMVIDVEAKDAAE